MRDTENRHEDVPEKGIARRVLDPIFALPPIEKRKMSQGFLRTYFLPQRFTLRSDDTYIYYLCARDCFFVTSALLSLNWVSLVWQVDFNLFFFTIDLPERGFINAFANSFPFYTSTILFSTIVPFYLLKFFYNINPKKVDVLWWYLNISQKSKRTRWIIIPFFTYFFIICFVIMYGAFGLLLYLEEKLLLVDSHSFLVFASFVFAIAFSGMPLYAIFSIAALYRYIGPYKSPLSSSSIREGKQS